jgi:dihydrofolate reductase (trimethoprim resistance protein)
MVEIKTIKDLKKHLTVGAKVKLTFFGGNENAWLDMERLVTKSDERGYILFAQGINPERTFIAWPKEGEFSPTNPPSDCYFLDFNGYKISYQVLGQNSPKFSLGDLVYKKSGAAWEGRVVGTYSTELTPEGYAVESSIHKGSVQIYPAAALELLNF